MNSLLQNYSGTLASTTATSFVCPFIDIQSHDYLTLRSKRLASRNVMSVRHESDILLRVPIDVAFGEIINANTSWSESVSIGRTLHKTLDFQVTDRLGNVITTLYDPVISFILVLYG